MNYPQVIGTNTVLEPINLELQPIGSETALRPIDPIEQFFAARTELQRWEVVARIPRDESSVQQIIGYVMRRGGTDDTDDAISLLATIGWATFAVARTYQFAPTRIVKPMYIALGWELLAQSLVTANIDAVVKRQFLSELAKSKSSAIAYVARDALQSLD